MLPLSYCVYCFFHWKKVQHESVPAHCHVAHEERIENIYSCFVWRNLEVVIDAYKQSPACDSRGH